MEKPAQIAVRCIISAMPMILIPAAAILSQAKQGPVKADYSLRTRFERNTDRDFFDSVNDNSSVLLSRFRPGLGYSEGNWRFRLEYQYAHALFQTGSRNYSTENSDVSELSGTNTGLWGSFTLGRQKFKLGDGRLVSTTDWGNVARSYDGLSFQSKEWTGFLFKDAIVRNRQQDLRLAGLAHRFPGGGEAAYILKTNNSPAGSTALHTLDYRWKGKSGSTALAYEVAGQVGRSAGRDHSAYAIHAEAAVPIGKRATLTGEVNLASGGQSPDHTRTFDELGASTHGFYGYMDFVGWRNMKEFAVKSQIRLDAESSVYVGLHGFWLFDPADGFYSGGSVNRGGAGSFIDPAGASGSHLGTEFDIEYSRKFTAGEARIGVGFFEPGEFIKNMNGGSIRRAMYFYTQVAIRF